MKQVEAEQIESNSHLGTNFSYCSVGLFTSLAAIRLQQRADEEGPTILRQKFIVVVFTGT